MKRRVKSTSYGGFSLTEILVVAGILIILISMVVPTVGYVREKAKSSLCVQKLRELGFGVHNYVAENGTYLIAYNGYFGYWTDLISPYMDGRKVDAITYSNLPAWIVCPSKPGRIGYGWNYYHFGHNTSTKTNTILSRPAQVSEASKTVLIADSADDPEAQRTEHLVVYGTKSKLAKRHAGGVANFLFTDGHVEGLNTNQAGERLPRMFEKYPGEKSFLDGLDK